MHIHAAGEIFRAIAVFFCYTSTLTILTRARTSQSHLYIAGATAMSVVVFYFSFDILFSNGHLNWNSFWPFLIGN